jgi:hypothetical protein
MAIQKPNKARPTSAFVSVRSTRAQYEELQKLAGVMLRGTVNGIVQNARDGFIECEAEVWFAAAKRASRNVIDFSATQ